MSENTALQIRPAKDIQFRKAENLGQRLPSVDNGEVCWARDEHNQVTSAKSSSRPYDQTTHPPSPRTNTQLQTPRPSFDLARLQIIDDPIPTSPASAYSHTARHVPREGQYAARDGRYYLYQTSAAKRIPPAPAPASQTQTPSHAKQAPRHFLSKQLPPLSNWKPGRKPPSFSPRRQVPKSRRNIYPLTPFEPSSSYLATMLLADKAAEPKSSHVAARAANKATSWASNLRRRHSPAEIFNMSFSFSSASRRPSLGSSPEISPRSSIASPLPSFSSREEPYKRKRIDSSDSSIETQNPKSFNRPRIVAAPTAPTAPPAKPCVNQGQPLSLQTEAHPGSPVDFSSPSLGPGPGSSPIPIPQSARSPHHNSHKYHAYLVRNAKRRNSSSTMYRVDPSDLKIQARDEKLCKEARILGLDTNPPSTRQPCKSAPGGKDRTARKTPPHSALSSPTVSALPSPCATPLTPPSANKTRFPQRTSSSMSDPTTEAFLKHVRASQEARVAAARQKKKQEDREKEKQKSCEAGSWDETIGYTVFTDEDERGFLSDDPL